MDDESTKKCLTSGQEVSGRLGIHTEAVLFKAQLIAFCFVCFSDLRALKTRGWPLPGS